MAEMACQVTVGLLGGGDFPDREEMMELLACLDLRVLWETRAWPDHWDRKVRRAGTRCMSLYLALREVKETEASQVSQDVRDLLGARAIKE